MASCEHNHAKRCEACNRAHRAQKQRERRHADPDKSKEYQRLRRAADPEHFRKLERDYWARDPAKLAAKNAATSGFPYAPGELERARIMWDTIEECSLCERPFGESGLKRAIDHCHKTGIVRGIIHHHCNILIGGFGDNPVALRRAADYLERAAAR